MLINNCLRRDFEIKLKGYIRFHFFIVGCYILHILSNFVQFVRFKDVIYHDLLINLVANTTDARTHYTSSADANLLRTTSWWTLRSGGSPKQQICDMCLH